MHMVKFIFLSFFFAGSLLAQNYKIVVTTTLISAVVNDIGKEKVKVETLIPPGQCPGHFDIKISHLKSLEKTGILFAHGYENYLDKLRKVIKNPDFKIYLIKEDMNWLIPEMQLRANQEITGILSSLFPEEKKYFHQNLLKSEKQIKLLDKEIKEKIKQHQLKGKKVICDKYLKDLLSYLEFNIVETYGRKEELTPLKISSLIRKGREEKVELIVDNMQSGPDTGKSLADDLKIPHIVFSNYPGVYSKTDNLGNTLNKNAEKIFKIYEK